MANWGYFTPTFGSYISVYNWCPPCIDQWFTRLCPDKNRDFVNFPMGEITKSFELEVRNLIKLHPTSAAKKSPEISNRTPSRSNFKSKRLDHNGEGEDQAVHAWIRGGVVCVKGLRSKLSLVGFNPMKKYVRQTGFIFPK